MMNEEYQRVKAAAGSDGNSGNGGGQAASDYMDLN
jgi:hypothetical protein